MFVKYIFFRYNINYILVKGCEVVSESQKYDKEWLELVLDSLKMNGAELANELGLSQAAISRWKLRGVPKKYVSLLTIMMSNKSKTELHIPRTKLEIIYLSKLDMIEIAALAGGNASAVRAQKLGNKKNYAIRLVLTSLKANGISTIEEASLFVKFLSKKITEYRAAHKKYPLLLTAVPDLGSVKYLLKMSHVEICSIIGISKNSLTLQKYSHEKKFKERMIYLQLLFNGITSLKELESAYEFMC